jgi:hypothetical protein
MLLQAQSSPTKLVLEALEPPKQTGVPAEILESASPLEPMQARRLMPPTKRRSSYHSLDFEAFEIWI